MLARIQRLTKPDAAALYQLLFIALRNLENPERFSIEIELFELEAVEYWMFTFTAKELRYCIDLRRAKTTGQIIIKNPKPDHINRAKNYLTVVLALNNLL